MLQFLGQEANHGERIDFVNKNTNIEVWKPLDIKAQRKAVQYIDAICQSFALELGCLHQIVYSPWERPHIAKHVKSDLVRGPVIFAAEILLDIKGFQTEIVKCFWNTIRKKRAKFLKERKRGSIAIDMRHLTVVDPAILSAELQKKFTLKDAEALDGIYLITLNPYDSLSDTKLIVVQNPKSHSPLSKNNFHQSSFAEPFHVSYLYAFPTIIKAEKRGVHEFVARTNEGMLVINDQEVARSLTAEVPVAITGLMRRPSKLKYIEFGVDNKKIKIPF